MKNISCWAFRALFPEATDSYTEMLNLKEIITLRKRAWDNIDTFPIHNQQQWVQVLTNNVKDMASLPAIFDKFCRDNPERANIYGVCINACCPDPRVISAGEGAALVKRTKRLGDLIINFKHAKQTSKSKPHWELLETALNAEKPIIVNGNIDNNQDFHNIIKELPLKSQRKCNTLISGIMIGRGAIKNLNCFQSFLTSPHEKVISKKALIVDNLNKHPPHRRFYKNVKDFNPFLMKA